MCLNLRNHGKSLGRTQPTDISANRLFYSDFTAKKEKKKKKKRKKQRATVKRNRALEETERRKASLKCFMQIKITECTQVVQVYNIPGAHQTKALSAFCCSLFPLCPFISKKSPRKTSSFFFPLQFSGSVVLFYTIPINRPR